MYELTDVASSLSLTRLSSVSLWLGLCLPLPAPVLSDLPLLLVFKTQLALNQEQHLHMGGSPLAWMAHGAPGSCHGEERVNSR